MRNALIGLIALGAMTLAPSIASAGHRFDTRDRGSRYDGGYRGYHGGGRSSSFFGVSIGFGGSSCNNYGYSRFSYNSCAPVYRAPVYCPPRVVYAPPPVYCPPVVYAPAPVYYAPPIQYSAPCYTPVTNYYYSGSYYYGR